LLKENSECILNAILSIVRVVIKLIITIPTNIFDIFIIIAFKLIINIIF